MLNLDKDTYRFTHSKIAYYNKQIKLFQKISVFLNIVIILASFATTIITSLIMSRLIYDGYPDWFFYSTAGISALTGLASGLLNFFVIKDNIKSYKSIVAKIEAEFISYSTQAKSIYQCKSESKNRYHLFLSVATITGSKAAKKEMKNVK